jgi:hypothetical protein
VVARFRTTAADIAELITNILGFTEAGARTPAETLVALHIVEAHFRRAISDHRSDAPELFAEAAKQAASYDQHIAKIAQIRGSIHRKDLQ